MGRGTVVGVLATTLLATAAAAWAPPVGGGVDRPFAFDEAAPYVAGAHRGIDLAARPGEAVRAPCAGRVSFAGRVPGHGRGVTVRCGRLAATLLDLGRVRVRPGRHVGRGRPVGSAGGRTVHLGARRAADRHGYLDPARLLAAPGGPAGVPAVVPRPRPRPPHRTWRPARAPAPTVPAAAYAGLALLAAGMPVGAIVRRRRRGRSIASARRWPST